jgi:ABC-type lipoprotein release transport system permease subunit
MSILFVVIISTMIISDNKKFISTMKVIGYQNKEIRKIFLFSFLPSLLIGLLLAIPFIAGTLLSIKLVVLSFGNILIPLHLAG